MFHAARSILFRDGVKERSHLCVVSYIQESYPQLKRLANQLDSYRRNRHNTLYALDFLTSDEEAQQDIASADSPTQKEHVTRSVKIKVAKMPTLGAASKL